MYVSQIKINSNGEKYLKISSCKIYYLLVWGRDYALMISLTTVPISYLLLLRKQSFVFGLVASKVMFGPILS